MTNENQQGTKTTRRNFLKGAGLALAGATAFGLAGCASGEADSASSNEKWDGEYDVIVAGAGIAGLTAAITVADEGDGASCLVVEKDSLPEREQPVLRGLAAVFRRNRRPDELLGTPYRGKHSGSNHQGVRGRIEGKPELDFGFGG